MHPYAHLWSLRTAMQLSLGPMHKAPRCVTRLGPLKSVLKTRRRDLVRWKAKIELRSMQSKKVFAKNGPQNVFFPVSLKWRRS